MTSSTVTDRGAPTDDTAQERGLIEELAGKIDALEFCLDVPEVVLVRADEAALAAKRFGREDLELRATLVRAHCLLRSGEIAAGGRIAHQINRQAMGHADMHLLARSHRVLILFFRLIGDSSAQLEHAVRAVECLDEGCSDQMRADHLNVLGVALGLVGSFEESRARFQAAGAIALAIGDVDLQISALNNLACLDDYDPNGDAVAAMEGAERMVALSAQHSLQLDMCCRETVARAQMGLGRYAEAERTVLAVFDEWLGVRGDLEGDSDAECLITLGEIQRLLGATDRAGATLGRCMEICEERGLSKLRVRVLREWAELYAVEGAYQKAYEQLRTFLAEKEALDSIERDARARTLHAVFETDEARQDSLRFREMSLRDPLTGLYNRRFIDEQLDAVLSQVAASGSQVSIGLVDLDHFKQVNDTLSHGVGDEVLKTVAGLLTESVTEPAFAARLGGEEFLLVLPGCDAEEALARCEAARLRIAAHVWSGLTGEMAITASIGVATVAAGLTTRATLLADADGSLYAAKRAGRNRVMSATGGPDVDGYGRRRQLRDAL